MQFHLSSLLLLFVSLASCMALLSGCGICILPYILIFLVVLRMFCNRLSARTFVILLVVLLPILFELLTALVSARGPNSRGQCTNNLKEINLALQAYRQQYGRFPPVCSSDIGSKPTHSWRVLILPQLGHGALFERYRFDERWNSPHNQKVSDAMPEAYECRGAIWKDRNLPPLTSYVAVTGQGTAWQRSESTRPGSPGRIDSQAVLVTEVADSDIHWMEPRDLDLDQQPGSAENVARVAANHRNYPKHFWEKVTTGGHVACACGAVRWLPASTRLDDVDACRAGRTWTDYFSRRFAWSRCVALIVMLISSGVLADRMWRAM